MLKRRESSKSYEGRLKERNGKASTESQSATEHGAVTRLEVERQPDGSVIACEGKEDCKQVIMEEILPCF